MRRGWKAATAAVVLLGMGGGASAHEFTCQKWVEVPGAGWSDEEPPVVKRFPVKLKVGYLLKNVHPTEASVTTGVEDRLMEPYGFRYPFPTPLTLGVGEQHQASFELELDSHQACIALAASDGKADAHFDSALWVKWDLGQTQCATRVTCCTPFADCELGCPPEDPPCTEPPEVGPSRHAGFFKVHEQALARCLAHGPVGLGRVARVETLEQALGLLWASPGLHQDGTAREPAAARRLELARETLVGECNARLFGTSGGEALEAARQLLRLPIGGVPGTLVEKLERHNAAGSAQPLPPGFDAGPATPAHAASIADEPTR